METEEVIMATGGVVRKIDKLGRIVIPAEYRKSIGVEVKEEVEILLKGNTVTLQKYEMGCIFCGNKYATSMYHEKWICDKCRKNLAHE